MCCSQNTESYPTSKNIENMLEVKSHLSRETFEGQVKYFSQYLSSNHNNVISSIFISINVFFGAPFESFNCNEGCAYMELCAKMWGLNCLEKNIYIH